MIIVDGRPVLLRSVAHAAASIDDSDPARQRRRLKLLGEQLQQEVRLSLMTCQQRWPDLPPLERILLLTSHLNQDVLRQTLSDGLALPVRSLAAASDEHAPLEPGRIAARGLCLYQLPGKGRAAA